MLSRTITTLATAMLLGAVAAAPASNECGHCSNDAEKACSQNSDCTVGCDTGTCVNPHANRPNVVLFVADDQGWADLPLFSGDEHYLEGIQQLAVCDDPDLDCSELKLLDPGNQCPKCLTPNLDDLASHGVTFPQFYAAAPLCAPSRASIMTGRYGRRTGVTANQSLRTLDPIEVTVAEHLSSGCKTSEDDTDVCYTTGMMGKWHNTWSSSAPWNQGFQEFVGFERSEMALSQRKWRCYPAQPASTPSQDLRRFLRASASGPSYLQLDPNREDDVCRGDSKHGDGIITIPAYAPCIDPDGDGGQPGRCGVGNGALRCRGKTFEEDCPFYGCIGSCGNKQPVRPCMTDGNCRDTAEDLDICRDYAGCTGSTSIDFCEPGGACDPETQRDIATIVREDARHSTYVLRDLAVSFVERHKADTCPFFLVVPLRSPHTPTKAPFDQDRFEYVPGKIQQHGLWAGIQDNDALIGDVMDAVKDDPKRKTLVLFTSDNGKEHHSELSAGSKMQVWEGGIRVGLVARLDGPVVQGAPGPPAPQDIPAGGAIAGQIGQHNDLFATIAAAAGAPLQPWDVPGNPDCLGTSQDLTPQGPAGDSRPMPVDGRDLLPILRNPAAADVHDFMFFHYEGEAVRSRPGFYSDNAAVDTDPLLAGPDYPPSLFAGRTAAGETCQPCAEGVPDPDSSCDKAAWKLIKAMRPSDDPEETESKGWRLYNLAKDPKERTDCLADTNLPAEELVKVQNVGQDMCRRAAYWQKFTPRGQWQQQPPEQRCVENVTRGTLQAWWSSTHANDATAPCL